MESKQVLSIEQMQHLQELGLDTSKASMCWLKDITKEIAEEKEIDMTIGWFLDFNNPEFYKYEWMKGIPTFTLQDILELLPYKIVASYLNIGKKSFSGDVLFYIEYSNFGGYAISHFRSESLLDAAYEMLYWCVESGHAETDKTNKP